MLMRTQIVFASLVVIATFTNLPAQAAPTKFGKVNVAGVSINGLNQAEATRRLKRELAPKLRTAVRLNGGAVAVSRRRADLGVELNIGGMLARARKQPYVPLMLRVNRAPGFVSRQSANSARTKCAKFKFRWRGCACCANRKQCHHASTHIAGLSSYCSNHARSLEGC
jgi:hypothetical protein